MKNNKNLKDLEKTDLDAQNECEHWRRFFLETSFANAGNWCRRSNQDCSKLRTTYKVMNHMLRLKDLTWKPSAHAANTHWNNKSLAKPKNTPRNEKKRVTDEVSKNKSRKR